MFDHRGVSLTFSPTHSLRVFHPCYLEPVGGYSILHTRCLLGPRWESWLQIRWRFDSIRVCRRSDSLPLLSARLRLTWMESCVMGYGICSVIVGANFVLAWLSLMSGLSFVGDAESGCIIFADCFLLISENELELNVADRHSQVSRK